MFHFNTSIVQFNLFQVQKLVQSTLPGHRLGAYSGQFFGLSALSSACTWRHPVQIYVVPTKLNFGHGRNSSYLQL